LLEGQNISSKTLWQFELISASVIEALARLIQKISSSNSALLSSLTFGALREITQLVEILSPKLQDDLLGLLNQFMPLPGRGDSPLLIRLILELFEFRISSQIKELPDKSSVKKKIIKLDLRLLKYDADLFL
jgi:hypothetical protein